MDENLSRGYVQLGKARGMNEFKLNNGFNHLSPPVDKGNFVYLALVLAGVSFLMPYNSFMMAVDYFKATYPDTTVMFDMSVVYVSMAFFAVFANNILVETVSLNKRITFGYIVSVITLNFVIFSEIWWKIFGVGTSYTINLVAVAFVAVGCTVQQSSFYGYTSMLPSRYTQAVMTGESAAGFWISIYRILTKLLINDERLSTSTFFSLSVITIFGCFMLHRIARKTEFVRFYVNLCQERNRIILEPTEDVGLMDPMEPANDPSKGQYGILKIQTSPLGTDMASSSADGGNGNGQCSAFSFSNPVYEPGAPSNNSAGNSGPTYKVEDVVVMQGAYYRGQGNKRWDSIKRGLSARLEVAKLIYPYMASIGIAYFVTLSLYPGILSEIMSCKFESWMPVILMATFNGADLLGKILASVDKWRKPQLLFFSCGRIILIPLVLFCAMPRKAPFLYDPDFSLMLSAALGLSNGIVGSVPMIQAPSKVPEQHRELAGNIMTLSYTTGLALGSLLAYVLDAFLGPVIPLKEMCDPLNFSTQAINNITMSEVMNVAKVTIDTATRTPLGETTMATLTNLFITSMSTLATNSTLSTLGDGLLNASSTVLPKIITNASSNISNSILHQ